MYHDTFDLNNGRVINLIFNNNFILPFIHRLGRPYIIQILKCIALYPLSNSFPVESSGVSLSIIAPFHDDPTPQQEDTERPCDKLWDYEVGMKRGRDMYPTPRSKIVNVWLHKK